MGKRRHIVLSDHRDLPILDFLWRWKLATTATLAVRFFEGRKLNTIYNQLNRIRAGGYIDWRFDAYGQCAYWTLTPLGFAAVCDRLPDLREAGFRSEHVRHDALVTALHIGDWVFGAPPGVSFFSEQQLRRHYPTDYPQWVPRSERHRPDGYWGISKDGNIVTIAIELEINKKGGGFYESVADFYADQGRVHRVLWVVGTGSLASHIQDTIRKTVRERYDIHNFVALADFQKECWMAKVKIGPDREKSISEFLHGYCDTTWSTPSQNLVRGPGHPVFETRKKRITAAVCSTPNFGQKPN